MAITSYVGLGVVAGTPHVKGAYTQIVASTPYASSRLFLLCQSANNAPCFFLLDLATGAAGSETVIVSNLATANQVNSDSLCGGWTPIQVDIAAGTRLAARVQSTVSGVTFTIAVQLQDRALGGLTAPVTYGSLTGTSVATAIDPGTTANTKGSYVQLTASTSARIDALLVTTTIFTVGPTTFQTWNVDVATGASGSETIVLPDLRYCANSVARMTYPSFSVFPVSIPSGTRLAVRASCTATAVNQRNITVGLIGMQEPASAGGGGATSVAYIG